MPLCSPLTGADELKSTKLWLQQSDPNVQTTKLRPRLTFSVSEEISVDDFILDLLLDQLLEVAERLGAIDLRLALAESVEVGAVDDADFHGEGLGIGMAGARWNPAHSHAASALTGLRAMS